MILNLLKKNKLFVRTVFELKKIDVPTYLTSYAMPSQRFCLNFGIVIKYFFISPRLSFRIFCFCSNSVVFHIENCMSVSQYKKKIFGKNFFLKGQRIFVGHQCKLAHK